MSNENKEIDGGDKEESLLEFLSRSPLDAILPFLDRTDEPPRNLDGCGFYEDDSLVHEAFPKDK